MTDLHAKYGLTHVINLSGPLTMYGTSSSSQHVCAAAAESLRHHWDMDQLFARAGEWTSWPTACARSSPAERRSSE